MDFRPFKIGKYLLLEKLASGGMAEVYRAKASGAGGFEKQLAIKRILPTYSQNEEFRRMFEYEARLSSMLTHSNIVQIYDFVKSGETYLLAMEYVDGKNLRQFVNKAKKMNVSLPVEFGVNVINEVCKGLEYAHKKKDDLNGRALNIIHRDMSPQNVMLSYDGAVKIVDFGIAKAKDRVDETRSGVIKGKFGYMSPEQANGEPVDHRSDIFSTGIILFELLTGRRLFASENDMATLKLIQECVIPTPSRINPKITSELERILLKALTKDLRLRYQDAGLFHRNLQEYMNKYFPSFTQKDAEGVLQKVFRDEIAHEKRRFEQIHRQSIPFSQGDVKNESEDFGDLEEALEGSITKSEAGSNTAVTFIDEDSEMEKPVERSAADSAVAGAGAPTIQRTVAREQPGDDTQVEPVFIEEDAEVSLPTLSGEKKPRQQKGSFKVLEPDPEEADDGTTEITKIGDDSVDLEAEEAGERPSSSPKSEEQAEELEPENEQTGSHTLIDPGSGSLGRGPRKNSGSFTIRELSGEDIKINSNVQAFVEKEKQTGSFADANEKMPILTDGQLPPEPQIVQPGFSGKPNRFPSGARERENHRIELGDPIDDGDRQFRGRSVSTADNADVEPSLSLSLDSEREITGNRRSPYYPEREEYVPKKRWAFLSFLFFCVVMGLTVYSYRIYLNGDLIKIAKRIDKWRKVRGVAEDNSPTPIPTPVATATPVPTPTAAPAAVACAIRIDTDPPGAKVFINNKDFGTTSAVISAPCNQAIDITIRKDGFETVSANVVTNEKEKKLMKVLSEIPLGTLSLSVNRLSMVYVDGVLSGEASPAKGPLEIQVRANRKISVRFVNAIFKIDTVREFVVEKDQILRKAVRLEENTAPVPKAPPPRRRK